MEITKKEKNKIRHILWRRTNWDAETLDGLIQDYLSGRDIFLTIELLEAIRGNDDGDVYYFEMKKPQLVTQLRMIQKELTQNKGNLN